jgi:ferrous iron transport protein B
MSNVAEGTIALVGHHNVGKSLIFQRLTGSRVTVANYPGTTVEVARSTGPSTLGAALLDTPGVITFPTRTEDERATSRALLKEPLRAVVQVGDAKNVRRSLLLTLQLIEMQLPMLLVLNMTDEADLRGVRVEHHKLSEQLGVPVVPTVAIRGEGLDELGKALANSTAPVPRLHYAGSIEQALEEIVPLIPDSSLSPRGLALFWLSGDPEAELWLRQSLDEATWKRLVGRRQALEAELGQSASTTILATRLAYVEHLAGTVLLDSGTQSDGFAARLGRISVHPIWGLPLLVSVLAAVYLFVGHFGAGILVDLLEVKLFGEIINPWIIQTVGSISPIPLLTEFLVGPYGLWTMGMTYALALILPIVATFFLAFGVLEDTGYLPRLSVISNRLFSRIGLNGKAVLPMVLGLGCVTMATMTTRVLESRRDRTLATLLLALGIPCSAQLGIVMGMLAAVSLGATLIWAGVVVLVMLVVGWLAARLLPGSRSPLMMELPPLRRPVASNLAVKTLARVEWYLKEVVPLFLLGAAIMFLLVKTGVLTGIIGLGTPLVTGWLGLPPEASEAFVMGFIRRDFGASGLFMMSSVGLLSPLQITVAMVTITLFIPCVASVFMIAKERGRRVAIGMVVLIIPLAFLVGGLLFRLLFTLGWGL